MMFEEEMIQTKGDDDRRSDDSAKGALICKHSENQRGGWGVIEEVMMQQRVR